LKAKRGIEIDLKDNLEYKKKIRKNVVQQYSKTQELINNELDRYNRRSLQKENRNDLHEKNDEDNETNEPLISASIRKENCEFAMDKISPTFPSNYQTLSPYILESHAYIPLNWAQVFGGKPISKVVFCDGDQIIPEINVEFPPWVIFFFVYSDGFYLPETSNLTKGIYSGNLLLLCTGSKKEMADNVVTLLALESHYAYPNKDFEIVICSNDTGFDVSVTNLKARHRQARRLCGEGRLRLSDILAKIDC
jgi:hypothetical protein